MNETDIIESLKKIRLKEASVKKKQTDDAGKMASDRIWQEIVERRAEFEIQKLANEWMVNDDREPKLKSKPKPKKVPKPEGRGDFA